MNNVAANYLSVIGSVTAMCQENLMLRSRVAELEQAIAAMQFQGSNGEKKQDRDEGAEIAEELRRTRPRGL